MKKLIVVLTVLGGMLVFADAKSDFDGAIQMIKDNNIPTAVKSLEKLSKGKDKEYAAKAYKDSLQKILDVTNKLQEGVDE